MDVLLVDDDDEIRTLLSALLTDEGYGVREAMDGREAMDILQAEGELPALILLDLMMPVMNGLEVLDELALSERLREIPVIVMTAAPEKAIGRGRAIVQKPFDITTLLREIRLVEAGAVPIAK
jgi:CheY-like chemotaxis protein